MKSIATGRKVYHYSRTYFGTHDGITMSYLPMIEIDTHEYACKLIRIVDEYKLV